MIADRTRRRLACAALLALSGIALGCAPRPLLARAVAARGGAAPGVVVESVADVHRFVPGQWRYARIFRAPDCYAWQLETALGTDTHSFDGRTVRSFVQGELVGTDPRPSAPLRSQARWMAVWLFDALADPTVRVTPLPAAALPAGAREGLRVVFADGATYQLAFDAAATLVHMAGPLDLSPLARGTAEVAFGPAAAFADGLRLPATARYVIDGVHVADETLQRACRTPASLTAAAFADPPLLPRCTP